ncbi:MAG: hemerythrin family protein [Candidatus Delongbacteria bacterium]|nr:hemerythrin family protein [Candidatus Delongbacteria bacterium]MBN2836963.1 hemerythrin family protein [Candidatus Delongbacteria bacterium]
MKHFEIFKWDPMLDTGVDIIDQQHKMLTRIFNKQIDYRDSFKGFDALKKTLERVIKFAELHFKTEEDLLKKHNYPDYDYHKYEHTKIMDTLKKFESEINRGNSRVSSEFLEFLYEWLDHHVRYEDIKFSGFLKAAGC